MITVDVVVVGTVVVVGSCVVVVDVLISTGAGGSLVASKNENLR